MVSVPNHIDPSKAPAALELIPQQCHGSQMFVSEDLDLIIGEVLEIIHCD